MTRGAMTNMPSNLKRDTTRRVRSVSKLRPGEWSTTGYRAELETPRFSWWRRERDGTIERFVGRTPRWIVGVGLIAVAVGLLAGLALAVGWIPLVWLVPTIVLAFMLVVAGLANAVSAKKRGSAHGWEIEVIVFDREAGTLFVNGEESVVSAIDGIERVRFAVLSTGTGHGARHWNYHSHLVARERIDDPAGVGENSIEPGVRFRLIAVCEHRWGKRQGSRLSWSGTTLRTCWE